MRKTKIVCTLGPATDDEKVLKELFLSGMNVARLNFSHGTHDEYKKTIEKFIKIRDELEMPVALLLDTKGPEVRIKTFETGSVELEAGRMFTLTTDDLSGDERGVSITYSGLPSDVNRGDRILLDDGLIEMKVTNIKGNDIQCEIINGGTVSNNKGVNVPGVSVNLPYISEKDREDILFAAENDFEFIAASFVRSAENIREIKKILDSSSGGNIKIIAKIENREGVDNIDDIISVSDGIMVARGDMGVEIPFEELPGIQKKIIKKCYISGKPVITATQMLDSMIRNPRPTRAEITDVANAIYDGTCAIMLSGETSIGRYPVDALRTMSKIAVETEKNIDYAAKFEDRHIAVSRNVTKAISHATCSTAHRLGASSIITVTKSGHTANMVSRYRPACSIIATTTLKKVFYQLALSWGVFPVMTELKDTTDKIFAHSIEISSGLGLIKNGDLVVITGGMPVGISGTTNILKVHIVGDILVEGRGINKLTFTGNLCVLHEGDETVKHFNAGDILVISKTTDEVFPALKHASAIVTEENMEDSRAAVVGMALEIPVITNAVGATEILKSGTVVTVDSGKGFVFTVQHVD